MYKHLFRIVLGVVGVLAMMSLGTVSATGQAIVTYNLNGGYWVENKNTDPKNVTYTRNDETNMYETTERWRTPSKYDSDGKKWMFDGWYTDEDTTKRWVTAITGDMSLYAKRLEFNDQTFTYTKNGYINGVYTSHSVDVTIMDRALGNGDHFQRGNNYGFEVCRIFYMCDYDGDGVGDYPDFSVGCFDEWDGAYICDGFPNRETINSNLQNITGYVSTYYNNSWIDSITDSVISDNARGGENSENPDEDKQGPCPEGYHVPDSQELDKWRGRGTSVRYNRHNADQLYNQTVFFVNATYQTSNHKYYSKLDGLQVRCFKNTKIRTLKFDSNGGNEIQDMKTSRWWENVIALPIPEYGNKIFNGWYTMPNGEGEKVTTNQILSGDDIITLYAEWICNTGYQENNEGTACEAINYNIRYELNGDIENKNPTTYTIETEDVTLINPTRTGYNFIGRSGNDINGLARLVVIKKGSTGDRVYEANRKKNPWYTFDGNGGVFSDGNPTNIIKYSNEQSRKFYTGCFDDKGFVISNSCYNSSFLKVIQFSGENNLHIVLLSQGILYVFTGEYTGDTGGNISGYLYKKTVYPYEYSEFDIEGDTLTLLGVSGWYPTSYYAIIYFDNKYITNDTIKIPTRDGYKFLGWIETGTSIFYDFDLPITGDKTLYAQWEKMQPTGGSSGGGGGGGGGNSSNNTGSASSQTGSQINSNIGSTASGTNEKEPEGTGNKAEIQTGSKNPQNDMLSGAIAKDPEISMDSSANASEGQKQQEFSQEFQQAYEFAKGNGITTMPTIQKANMNGPLTRIAMAKMLSQYAMNVLGQKAKNTFVPKFNDVTDKQNSDYNNGVTLAYQLGIMGQNMPGNKFRPNDEVTRGEFVTALSRMLYNTSDGEYKSTPKYYVHHMEKLKEEGIITKDDPSMKELRGYVMIMLMRSAK